ncbi:MAG TPA: metallophosphoesterase [Noviherbaspirillum sp.]|nr:metallophosphoesterase [Noviherbaspirillum sp.]
MGYDIIGDIHGEADKLEALLRKLGYRLGTNGYQHSGRQAIFVGDFIDKGPAQLRTINLVRQMVDSGAALAVLGNHELNAIAWHTPDPDNKKEFLRPHFSEKWGQKNRVQHIRFLEEVEHDARLHADIVNWFRTLPLWLDLPGLRVVHACWHTGYIDWLTARIGISRNLPDGLLPDATREPKDDKEKDTPEPSAFKAVEALTKGLEAPLPPGVQFLDKYGIPRDRVRLRWWEPGAKTFNRLAILPHEQASTLPEADIPVHLQLTVPSDKPIFFGHYWLTGDPQVLSPTVACVDYSAGADGPLVAYRWDGEQALSTKHFVQSH